MGIPRYTQLTWQVGMILCVSEERPSITTGPTDALGSLSSQFGRGMFPAPWPDRVLWFWGITGSTFAVLMTLWWQRARRHKVKAA